MTGQQLSPAAILVIEDDADIRELIVKQFQYEPYSLRSAGSLAEARAAMTEAPADLLVLDLNLPDGDGLSLCRELRDAGDETAIIMLTAREAPIDRVLGLELGADDYLTKPFEPRELLVRVRNLLRRHSSPRAQAAKPHFALFGPWRLDMFQRRLVTPTGKLVMLSSAEYRLLAHFVAHPTVVLSREQLLPERSATAAYDRSIDLQISRLRHKLATLPSGEELILTVRNEGYVLTSPVTFE